MTYKEKLSICFNSLLEEIDKIDNKEIQEKAVLGLLQVVTNQLTELKTYLSKGDDNGNK